MRIISPFKDYYDGVQKSIQVDLTISYVRNLITQKLDKWIFPSFGKNKNSSISYSDRLASVSVVGFCGKIYPLLECTTVQRNILNSEDLPTINIYSKQEADKFFSKYTKNYERSNSIYGVNKNIVNSFFDECKVNQNKYRDMFLDLRVPIFIARWSKSKNITLNAKLEDIDFMKLFDSFSAFQEIFMFMSNMAYPDKYIPPIDNDMKIATHGFDIKKSFRKEAKK